MTEPDTNEDLDHRIAIVFDITAHTYIATQHLAHTCLHHIHRYLTNRHINATPIRINIDGHTHLPRR